MATLQGSVAVKSDNVLPSTRMHLADGDSMHQNVC